MATLKQTKKPEYALGLTDIEARTLFALFSNLTISNMEAHVRVYCPSLVEECRDVLDTVYTVFTEAGFVTEKN